MIQARKRALIPTLKRHCRNATTISTPPPRIISRRQFQLQQKRRPPELKKTPIATSKAKGKEDDAKWDSSVIYAAYAAAGLFIPYSICTAVSSFPSLRTFLEGDKPHDPTDCKYGKMVVSWVRTNWTDDGQTFDGESLERMEQEIEISRILDEPVRISVRVENSGRDGAGDAMEGVGSLDASLPITKARAEILKGVGLNEEDVGVTSAISIEAVDDEEGNGATITGTGGQDDASDSLGQAISFGDSVDFSSVAESTTTTTAVESAKLRHLTHSFSTWHHFPNTGGGKEVVNPATMNAEERRISELEWKEAQLQMQMIDPNCTRDIDDMQAELKQIKSELKKARGWRFWK
mmetsp:Transcript_49173/g.73085  ORF Transcript_49173/g.73085 Transcript_49173/m.73085 type:complete len:349 (-) Transcript_49173:42-1088(-)